MIDTPGNDTYLMRLAHSMADTLVTPLNDSFVDFDVLATLDPTNFTVTGESHYAEMVREARRQRRLVDGRLTDWIVVRNRLSTLGSRNKKLVGEGIAELAKRMGFRCVDGFAERVVYREFFPRGLTAFDDLDEADARHPAEYVASDRARGSDRAAERAAPADVGKRQAPRRRPRRMVFGHGPAAAGPRPAGLRAVPSLAPYCAVATSGLRQLRCAIEFGVDCRAMSAPTRKDTSATSPGAGLVAAGNRRFPAKSEGLGPAVTAGKRGRLIFALDATMSRQPTWDSACALQADMFREAASIGGLDIQLVYFRGLSECRASGWVAGADKLGRPDVGASIAAAATPRSARC